LSRHMPAGGDADWRHQVARGKSPERMSRRETGSKAFSTADARRCTRMHADILGIM
jgi:hypothetical protein